MTDDLVKRLRDRQVCSIAQNSCRNDWRLEQAADRIEQLEREKASWKGAYDGAVLALTERNKELEAALREPTLDMLIAGKKSLYSCSEDPELDDARKCFKAMVAALGEKKDGD